MENILPIFDYGERQREKGDFSSATTVTAVVFAAKLLAWILIFLVALDNFGIDVTALIAGLGIGGIAIALALQNILKDLFASYFVLDADYIRSMDIRQAVNLRIHERFQDEAIEFAYPTQTLFLEKASA